MVSSVSMAPRNSAFAAGIVLAGTLAYLTSFGGVFLLDDVRSIVDEPRIRTLTDLGGSRPVVTLSLAINYRLGGLDPFGYHLFNLVVHLLAGLGLFGLVRRIACLAPRFRPHAACWAFVVALLWLVHPLQTASVTYVIQRGESLMGLFYLLTLYCTLRGATGERSRMWSRMWYGCAVAACALGMGTKAVMVTAPVAVFLLDWLVITGSPAASLRRRWGLYAALIATWGVLVATGVPAAIFGSGAPRTVGFDTSDLTVLEYAATQPAVILHYLRLAAWPHPLCFDYAWPVARGAAIAAPATAVAALVAATLWAMVRRPAIGFPAAAFFLVLAPTSSIVPIKDLAFEHRMYLPLAPAVALAVFGVGALLSRFGTVALRGGFVAALAAALILGIMTGARNRVYHNAGIMWRDVAAKRPDNPRAHTQLGRLAHDRNDPIAAIAHYRRALAADPGYFQAHHSFGLLLADAGRMTDAIPHLEEALRLEPGYFVAHNSLGNVYAALGRADDAIALYREAIRLEPDMPDPHNNLAIELARKGRAAEAVPHLVEAIRLNPAYDEAKGNLAIVLERTGAIDAAIAPYLDRAALAGPHAEAHVRAGRRAASEGRRADAVAAFERAIAIDPAHPDAARLLAIERRR